MLVVLDVVTQVGKENVAAIDMRYGSISYITR
jgi:hypothetical protein